jgi:protein involved in polysaccharide export with SLBB domain
MSLVQSLKRGFAQFVLLGFAAAAVEAQGSPSAGVTSATGSRQFETRQQLENQMRLAESQKRTADAWLLRSRLERGDFQEGDRLIVMLEGVAPPTMDTLQVRSGRVLQFPMMGELSLNGVLRSELTDKVRQHLARYLTTPVVRTIPLLPVAVFGSVLAPGYYDAPADIVLRDVLMRAGGPNAEADVSKTIIRRGDEIIWRVQDVRVALADGMSLDALHLRAGDEIFVPRRKAFNMSTLIAIMSSSMALTMAVVQLTR